MANININLKEVSEINARIPRYLVTLTGTRRELEILRWKLEQELMDKNYMRERYANILKRISEIENRINDVHRFISSSVMQYEEIEKYNESITDELY